MDQKRASERLKLEPLNPWRSVRLWALAVCSVCAAGAGGYFAGGYHTQAKLQASQELARGLAAELVHVRETSSQLEQQVANLETGHDIDKQANLRAQQLIRELKNGIASLEKDIVFYKNIMAPSEVIEGLQIQRLELKPSGPDQFQYKIVLTQVARNNRFIEGVVAVNLIGQKNGEQEVIPLRDVSAHTELGIKFKFRYFQDIEGELVLPEGFKPEKVQVVAQSKGKKAARVEQDFDWQMTEVNANVGQKQS